MKKNKFGEIILEYQDIINGLYSGNLTSLKDVKIMDQNLVSQFNQSVETNADSIDIAQCYVESNLTIEEFDIKNQKNWKIPEEYKKFDIGQWLLDQCKTPQEIERVIEELELFVQYEMIEVLICLKYLVDTMRKNKILWGLGRGSSVSSYCLYLIGIHKIDSIKYELDIREFLK